ncbi:unnamed protein product [Brassica oleracea var. botrytis]|uniref:Uncharacterized protein n=1 Tax=Brassica oleracea TaxID=3712 RepID=A0A3P6FZB6_BRAOL|nr:unnamed protein product [Brassica oleracea]
MGIYACVLFSKQISSSCPSFIYKPTLKATHTFVTIKNHSGTLFTAGEDRAITAWDTNRRKLAYSIQDAHPARIKGVVTLTKNDSDGASEDPYLVASASSDGIIRVWDMRMAAKENAKPLAETNTKSRLTCLAGSALKSMRRPQIGNQKAQKLEEGLNTE